jgi:glutathione peroxidase
VPAHHGGGRQARGLQQAATGKHARRDQALSVHEFSVRTADGGVQPLREYAGRVLIVVNVASQCGFTPQYAGLEALYRAGKDRGLTVLGFPCNQFGEQEPGMDPEIQEFCTTKYEVSFPVLAKIDVNGPQADPLYAFLRAEAPGEFGPSQGPLYEHLARSRPEIIGTDEVKWNFTKFLVGRDGSVLRRYESTVAPEELGQDLEPLLSGPMWPPSGSRT